MFEGPAGPHDPDDSVCAPDRWYGFESYGESGMRDVYDIDEVRPERVRTIGLDRLGRGQRSGNVR